MERYSVIKEKRKREIVLLRGSGCIYKRCNFCDYYSDSCPDEEENFLLNKTVLENVTGIYGDLEVINSGSVFELDNKTLDLIKSMCKKCNIKTIHFESHYLYDDRIEQLRKEFSNFDIKMKLGLESFDYNFRENILKKGINEKSPEIISKNFDEANLLFGIKGQTVESMRNDIQLGLKYFERICINIMCNNSTKIKPDKEIIRKFKEELFPAYMNDYRVDILVNNTDFGVGE